MMAEAFSGKLESHPNFNFQGINAHVLYEYGGRFKEGYWVFPDDSRGYFREDGRWADDTPRYCFMAVGAQADDAEDDLT